jgi:hypothetical protein
LVLRLVSQATSTGSLAMHENIFTLPTREFSPLELSVTLYLYQKKNEES